VAFASPFHRGYLQAERDTRPARRQVPTVRGLPNCEQALFALCRTEIRGGIVPTITAGREAVVPDAAARRLSNQVARAHSGTYGARAGLRTLARSVSLQMLRAGCSPDAVARALADHVLSCTAPATTDATIAINDAARLEGLVALTAECVFDAAVEMAARSASILATRAATSGSIHLADRR